MHAIVTGATGLLGRHLVQELCQRGWSVTAIVRQGSNRQPLEQVGVACVVCDLSCDRLDPRVFENVDAVFHAAGAVSDWAPWSYFVANTIRPLEAVCDAMGLSVKTSPSPLRTVTTSTAEPKSNPKKSPGSATARKNSPSRSSDPACFTVPVTALCSAALSRC
jgi:nucleoside-diphosphate-sugar epimerase